MVRSAFPGPSDRPVERVRATLDQGVRAVKTWWRAREAARPSPRPYGVEVDLTTESPRHDTSDDSTRDAVARYVTEEFDRMRREVDEHDVELLQALQRLASSYERVVERLETDRRERRLLAEAVLRLERRLSLLEPPDKPFTELPRGARVTGGWVSPATASNQTANAEGKPATSGDEGADPNTKPVDPIAELVGDPVSERH